MAAVERYHLAGMKAQPANRHRHGFRVKLRKVGEVELDPRIGERHRLTIAAYDLPARAESRGVELAGAAALSGPEVSDDIEKRFETGLHAGVGGVGIDFENQIRLGAHLGSEHRLSESVNGATEIAHAEEKQIGLLFHQIHRIHDLVGEMPRGRARARCGDQTVGGNRRHAHAR